MISGLNFKEPTEKFGIRPSTGEGLLGDHVKVKGSKSTKREKKKKKKSKKAKKTKELKLPKLKLKRPKSRPFSDDDEEGFVSMARGPVSLSGSEASMPSIRSFSGNSTKFEIPPIPDDDTSSLFSEGVSSYSSDRSLDKSFDIFRSEKKEESVYNGPSQDELDEAEKQDLLSRLHVIKSRGQIKLSKNYTARSSLNELRMEMGRLEHETETNRSVQRLRRWLMAFVSGAEYAVDSKYSPKIVKGRLNGFSEYVLGSVEDYDPVFEKFSERFGGVAGIGSSGNPLVDLLMLLGTQMVMFCVMNHSSKAKPPTEDEIKQEHPDLVRKAAKKMAEEMRNQERAEEAAEEAVRRQRQEMYDLQAQRAYASAQMQAMQSAIPIPIPVGMNPVNVTGQSSQYPIEINRIPSPTNPPPLEPIDPSSMMHQQMTEGMMSDQVFQAAEYSQKPSTLTREQELEIAKMLGEEVEITKHHTNLPFVQEENQEDTTGLPKYEPIETNNTYPKAPDQASRVVSFPDNAVSTRKGKKVKTNATPAKNSGKEKTVLNIE